MNELSTAPTETEGTARRARAVLYLRVSTTEQADKGADTEGYSIPAQREAGYRMAEQLDAEVVDEYLDRGESAKSADRPALQTMLGRLEEERDVDYVIVHKVDRLARSRADDVAITMTIRKCRAQLVSCSENVDETPSGRLLHGIMATIAEYYSGNLATEALKGMTSKAKQGGTPFWAPIGYRNISAVKVDGSTYRTVEIDEQRAVHVRWAFEAYATGDWSDRDIAADLEERGLRTRPTPKRPEAPLGRSRVASMLANPYYVGIVRFRGSSYPGIHEPLVSAEVFDRVQLVRKAHDVAGTRRRVHEHYLKGSIFCGSCGARMCLRKTVGQAGGVYFYFFCQKRADRSGCTQPYVTVERIENAVEDHYRRMQLPRWLVDEIRMSLGSEIAVAREAAQGTVGEQQKRIQKLKRQQTKLVQAHLADAIPLDVLKAEQERVRGELSQAESQLAGASTRFEELEEAWDAAIELAGVCGEAYLLADDQLRRRFNQAFFKKLLICQDEVGGAELKEPFRALLAPEATVVTGESEEGSEARDENENNPGRRYLREAPTTQGCHKDGLAPPTGFEPVPPP